MSDKNTITKSELAELLGVLPANIPALVKRGAIPGPVRGLCPMPSLRKPRLEETPLWDRQAVIEAWGKA